MISAYWPASCDADFKLLQVFIWRMLLAVYLLLTCILGCLLLCVLQQCLSSCLVFYCPCSIHDSVVTIGLLWIGMVHACIVSFCSGGSLVVCSEVSVILWLHPSWILLWVVCDIQWHLPLWQSNSCGISLVHAVSLMLLSMLCIFFLCLIGFCWWKQLALGCWCEVLYLVDS